MKIRLVGEEQMIDSFLVVVDQLKHFFEVKAIRTVKNFMKKAEDIRMQFHLQEYGGVVRLKFSPTDAQRIEGSYARGGSNYIEQGPK